MGDRATTERESSAVDISHTLDSMNTVARFLRYKAGSPIHYVSR